MLSTIFWLALRTSGGLFYALLSAMACYIVIMVIRKKDPLGVYREALTFRPVWYLQLLTIPASALAIVAALGATITWFMFP